MSIPSQKKILSAIKSKSSIAAAVSNALKKGKAVLSDLSAYEKPATEKQKAPVLFEPLEPRVLLSADFSVLASGVDTLDGTLDYFFNDEFLNTPLPGIDLQGDEGAYAPTLNELIALDIEDLGALADSSLNDALGIIGSTGDFSSSMDSNEDGRLGFNEFISGAFVDKITDYLADEDPSNAAFNTFIQSLDDSIDFLDLTSTYTDGSTAYQAADGANPAVNGDFSYIYDIAFDFEYSQDLLIDLGVQAESFGVTLDQMISVTAGLDFNLEFGVEYIDTAASNEVAVNDDFFIAITNTQATVSAGMDLSGTRIDFGFFEAEVDTGAADNIQLDVAIDASINNGNRYNPLANNALSGSDLINITASTNSFSIDLPVTISSLGLNQTVGLSYTTTDLFNQLQEGAAGFDIDLGLDTPDLDSLLSFDNLDTTTFLNTLNEVIKSLDVLQGYDAVTDFEIPFTDSDLGDVLDFAQTLERALLFDDLADEAKLLEWDDITDIDNRVLVPRFDSVQDLITVFNSFLGEDITAGYADESLTLAFSFEHEFEAFDVPIAFDLDLDPIANISSSAEISLGGSAGMDLILGFFLGDATEDQLLSDTTVLAIASRTVIAESKVSVYDSLSNDELIIGGQTLTISGLVGNSTIDDLSEDINTAIASNGQLDGVSVTASGEKLIIVADDSYTGSLRIGATNDDLGFVASAASQSITASESVVGFANEITDTSLEINGTTITLANLSSNTNIIHLVNDINDAIAEEAILEGISVSSIGNKLVITSDDVGTALNIGSNDELGFIKPELQITAGTAFVAAKGYDVTEFPNEITFDVELAGTTAFKNGNHSITLASDVTRDTLFEIITALNEELNNEGISGYVKAVDDNGSLSLVLGVYAKSTATFALKGTNVAANSGLGFSSTSIVYTELDPFKTSADTVGRFSSDIAFKINNIDIAVTSVATLDNNTVNDLVEDIQAAIDSSSLSGVSISSVSGNKLVINSESGSSLSVAGGDELGFSNETVYAPAVASEITANQDAFIITAQDGTEYGIELIDIDTISVEDLITAINTQTNGNISLEVNAERTGLNVIDNAFDVDLAAVVSKVAAEAADVASEASKVAKASQEIAEMEGATQAQKDQAASDAANKAAADSAADVAASTNMLSLSPTNNAAAAIFLGITGVDATIGEVGDGVISGGALAGLTLADRIFLDDTQIWGELELTASNVNATADFGFVEVSLDGEGAIGARLELGLTNPDDETSDKVTIADFKDTLFGDGLVTDLFDIAILGAVGEGANQTFGELNFGISVDGTGGILDTLNAGLSAVELSFVVEDLGNPFAIDAISGEAVPVLPTITFDTGVLDGLSLSNFSDIGFSEILDGLKFVADFLDDFESFGFLNDPIPLINYSVTDLLSYADQFDAAVQEAQSDPAGSLQLLEDKLEQALGVTDENAINLSLVTLGAQDFFKVELELALSYEEALGLDFDLSELLDTSALDATLASLLDEISFAGSADLAALGEITVSLDFGINLAAKSEDELSPSDFGDIYLFDSTGIEGSLNLGADNINFTGGFGPIEASIVDGWADVVLGFSAGFDFDDASTDPAAQILLDVSTLSFGLSEILDEFDYSLDFTVDSELPVALLNGSIEAGTIGISNIDSASTFDFEVTGLDEIVDAISFNFDDMSLIDKLLLAADGIDFFLEGVQDVMDGEIGGIELPFIGDSLEDGIQFIEDFRSGFVSDLRAEIENLTNPGEDIISTILNDLLGDSGLGILQDITSDTNIDVVGIAFDQTYMEWNLELGGTVVDAGVGIDFDLGIPGLGLETEGDMNIDIAWEFDFGFGISIEDGFYLVINDPDNSQPELRLTVLATLDDAAITGTLGFLQLDIETDQSVDALPTYLVASIGADIISSSDGEIDPDTGEPIIDARLGFSELSKLRIDTPSIAAEAVANLDFALSVSSDLLPEGSAGVFPEISTDFNFEWELKDEGAPSVTYVADGDIDISDFTFENPIALTDVSGDVIAAGLDFVGFDNVSLDLGSFISDFLGPILEQVKSVTDPLSDVIDFITAPLPVISDLGDDVSMLDLAKTFSTGKFDIGFLDSVIEIVRFVDEIADMAGDDGEVILNFGEFIIFDASTGQNAEDFTDSSTGSSAIKEIDKPTGTEAPLTTASSTDSVADTKSKNLINSLKSSGSFSLPLLTDPTQIFGLLTGDDVTLFAYDMNPLAFEFEYDQFFTIFGPLGASIGVNLGVELDFDFAFDTYGIQKFVDSGFVNPELIFAGFYIDDISDPHSEVILSGGITAAATLNLGIASGSVGGGLDATIDFNLYDPNRDGKIRIDEIVNSITFADNNPLAAFDISGEISAKVFWEVQFLFVEESGIIFEGTILEFAVEFEREPILATDLGAGILQLNMGEFADQRLNGNVTDGSENFTITDTGAGVTIGWGDVSQTYEGIDEILIRAGEGNDVVTLNGASNLNFDVDGGAGGDVISLGGTSGTVIAHGGKGNDTVTTGSGNDQVWGDEGSDILNTGNGDNWAFGDSGKIHKENEYIKSNVDYSDGVDIITAGTGNDILIGGGFNDTINGGSGDDLIIGDGAKIMAWDAADGTEPAALLTSNGFKVHLDLISKTEFGDDALQGADTLNGQDDDDLIFAGKGYDIISGGEDNDQIYAGAGNDVINGNDGSDTIYGGDGADIIDGDDGVDYLYGEAGNDVINGNLGNDQIWGGAGTDTLNGNENDDIIWGGSDNDTLHGNDGEDTLDGEAGHDTVFGDDDSDTITSSKGSDVLDGGEDADNYIINFDGFNATKLVTAYDSGTTAGDDIVINGTAEADTFLLRANRALGTDNDDKRNEIGIGLVAMMNTVADGEEAINNYERVDYNSTIESLNINSFAGNDYFALDDNRAITEIDAGADDDTFQIGQMFNTDREIADGNLANIQEHANPYGGNTDETDEFASIETTRGFLSNGVSYATTIAGGIGNDSFTVFHNIAVLNLEGDAGDDNFTVRAFALAGSTENQRARTNIDLSGDDAGDTNEVIVENDGAVDNVNYVLNALVNIDGGDGNDTLTVIGTEFSDTFIITEDGFFGAGLNVNFTNIENLIVDAAEGDDTFYIQGTLAEMTVYGGLGSDSFIIGGDSGIAVVGELYEEDVYDEETGTFLLHSAGDLKFGDDGNPIQSEASFKHDRSINDLMERITVYGLGDSEISIGSLGATLMLPDEIDTKPEMGAVISATVDTVTINTAVALDALALDSVDQLIDKTLEITDGTGKGQARIVKSAVIDGDNVILSVGPGSVSLGEWPWDTLPDDTSSYTLVDTNPNLLVDESEQIDVMLVLNNDSLLDDTGILTEDLLTGFGMGNGLEYHGLENFTFNMGDGANELVVNSIHTADTSIHGEEGFQTVTVIHAGAGADNIDVNLIQDTGLFAVRGEAGNDTIDASGSRLGIIAFGEEGDDELTGGTGNDVLFGDSGHVDYVDENGVVVTRFGANLELDLETIVAGTEDIDPVTKLPISGTENIIPVLVNNTDGVVRDATKIVSITEEAIGADIIHAGIGDNIVVAGAGVDEITTGLGNDIVIGDNGEINYQAIIDGNGATQLERVMTTASAHGAADNINVGDGNNIVLAGAAGDTVTSTDGIDIVIGDHGEINYNDAGFLTSIKTTEQISGEDIIDVGTGDNIVLAGGAADMITSTDGNDIVMGDYGHLIYNGAGQLTTAKTTDTDGDVDTINVGDGNNTVLAGAAGDTVTSTDGIDIVIGDHGEINYNDAGFLTSIKTTEQISGEDIIDVGTGDNIVLAGGAADMITSTDGNDIVMGDYGHLAYDELGQLTLIETTDTSGDDDSIDVGAGNDFVLAGAGADEITAGEGNDLVFGDYGRVEGTVDASQLPLNTLNPAFSFTATDIGAGIGGADTIYGDAGDDILLGQQGDDTIYGGTGDDDLIGGHNVAGGFDGNDRLDGGAGRDVIAGDNASINRRGDSQSVLLQSLLASTTTLYDNETGAASITGGLHSDNNDNAFPERDIELFDHASAATVDTHGNDYIAGGAGDDHIFGQLGDDVIQGDGAIGDVGSETNVSASVDENGLLTIAASVDSETDGNDYIEGNTGDDLIFGNLGQDSIVGGSSQYHGLDTADERADGSDTLFGGSGTQTERNIEGDESAHGRDADVILGDNANIYRLLDLSFSYDDAYDEQINPRVYDLLDYTVGAGGIGAADEIHGEAGDDIIHGMTGNDVLFGESQDDDIYGGSGDDRIYGGTGSDGIVGDDGIIHTSRNGQTEELHGLTVANAESSIKINGPFQTAIIYAEGEIHKSVSLLAYDEGALENGDDIIYGGWGVDFIHAGEGNDAISGAEALEAYYNSKAAESANNTLQYDAETGKFADYDADSPRDKITNTDGSEFFLNFDEAEQDGDDHIFGDLGNDWIVGGTGSDRMYGGFGDDLINADDDLSTSGIDTDDNVDFVFGGAGRDVMIANNTNDQLFDWSGEFNSYIVPFKNFGAPSVNRFASPAVVSFLIDLGSASGSDDSLDEPFGELGLVQQSDGPLWQTETGAPRDPQPGNGSGKIK